MQHKNCPCLPSSSSHCILRTSYNVYRACAIISVVVVLPRKSKSIGLPCIHSPRTKAPITPTFATFTENTKCNGNKINRLSSALSASTFQLNCHAFSSSIQSDSLTKLLYSPLPMSNFSFYTQNHAWRTPKGSSTVLQLVFQLEPYTNSFRCNICNCNPYVSISSTLLYTSLFLFLYLYIYPFITYNNNKEPT